MNFCKMQTNEYTNVNGISQSMIKDWENLTSKKWKNKYILKNESDNNLTESMLEGSFLDCLMFSPNDISKKFIINTVKLPSDGIKDIVETYYYEIKNKELPFISINSDNELLLQIANKKNYGNGAFKDDRIIKDITFKGADYFEFLLIKHEKLIVSSEYNLLALQMKKNIEEDFFVRKYLLDLPHKNHLILQSKYKNFDLKGELDSISIDEKNKIIRYFDLKKTDNTNNIYSVIWKFKYYYQQSYYKDLIKDNIELLEDIFKISNLKEYEIKNYNIIIDKYQKQPFLILYSNEDLEISKHGNEKIKGWLNSLEEIIYAIENDKFDYKKDYFEKMESEIPNINLFYD